MSKEAEIIMDLRRQLDAVRHDRDTLQAQKSCVVQRIEKLLATYGRMWEAVGATEEFAECVSKRAQAFAIHDMIMMLVRWGGSAMAYTNETADDVLMTRPLTKYENQELRQLEEKVRAQMCHAPDFRTPPMCYCHLPKGHHGSHQGRYPTEHGDGSLNVWDQRPTDLQGEK